MGVSIVSNPKQPSCKKGCGPKKAIVKKCKNPRWWPRNGSDGRLMVKFFNDKNSVLPSPHFTRIW